MPNKYDFIKFTFDDTSKEITKSPENWQSFLFSACRNFKLPFDEQVLIFAQRPDATAVLEFDKWNNRFGRWVNRGAKGIAVFDDVSGTNQMLKYYFDIADTHETEFSKPVPMWEYNADFESEVIGTLEDNFGELSKKDDIVDAVMSAAENMADDNLQDYTSELINYAQKGSFLEDLGDDGVETVFRNLVKNSVAFMMLTRLGFEPLEYFDREDFVDVVNFNTPETLAVLGDATSDIAGMGLAEIGKTVLSLQKENRTFAENEKSVYTETEIKNERGAEYDTAHQLHSSRWSDASEPVITAEQDNSVREIRGGTQGVSEEKPQAVLHEPEDAMQARRASAGGSGKSRADGRNADEEVIGTGGLDGAVEGFGYDDMGSDDEQPEAESSGNGDVRGDLSEISEELPPLTDEKLILALLGNEDDSLRYKKSFITERWAELNNSDEKGRYASTLYGGVWKEIDVDGTTVGCQHRNEGLYLYEGTFKSRTKESLFSWNLVGEILDGLIQSGKYYVLPEKEKSEPAQLGLFDFIDNAIPTEQPVNEPEQVSLFNDFDLPQQIIDEALCLGANDRQSTLDIVMVFRRDRGVEYNAKFLKSHYCTNGVGFFFDGEQISVWYDENGINIAKGNTAQKSSATHLTWEQAAKRIRELLDLGRYVPQYQLDKVDEHELSHLAERITTFYRDMDKDSKERCFPSLSEALNGVYGYPDEVKIVKDILSNPDTFYDFNNDYIEFMDDLNRGNIHGLYRFAFNYSPEYVYEIMQGMSLEKVDFKAQSGFNPDRQYFITNDEINKLLRRGSSYAESKYRIYTFFVNHSDMQERIKMIKEEYGTGGYSAGNDNANYDGKGLFFSHGSGMEPYAKVLLKWNDVVKRIDALIKADKFLSDEDIAKLPDIEKEHIANDVERFFEVMPDESYSNDLEPYRRKDVIKAQLDNPQALEDIDRMMSDALALMDKNNERDYKWHQEQYDRFVSFKNGEYHPYAVPVQAEPVHRPSKFSQPAKPETDEQDKELDAVYDLHNACKIDDMTVDFEGDTIIGFDDDGNEWKGADLYQFLLNEVLTFGADGKLVEGLSVDERIINSVLDYAKKYGVEPELVDDGISPIWKSYTQLEAQYPDVIIFSRLGDFYEVMGDNAKVVADELDLVLTGRTINTATGERTPMFGVPVNAVDSYISRIVANGHKVAIAESQEVNRVVTPGTAKDNSLIEQALDFILKYKREELGYDDEPPYGDLSDIGLAFTETEDGKHKIEVSADLVNFAINTFVDGKLFKQHKADSLDVLIHTQLESLAFDDLVYLDEEELSRIDKEGQAELGSLAERLVAFAKNTDFYDYADNLEIGETDEDAIRIMSEHLNDKTFCDGVISYLSDYAAEKSIDQHEAQQTFDTPDYSRVEEIQSLIHDLTAHTATLDDKAIPEAPDKSNITDDVLIIDPERELDYSDMIGDEIVIDGSHFIIEEVKGDYVSMRDVTFAENAGFPIFRRERIEDIFPLLPEKEEPVVEILPAPPQQPKSIVRTFDLHPEIPLEARHNYNFAEKDIESVGKKERFRRNMEAINVLKECEFEGRFATPEEQEILSQYVGWGGIPEAFDPNNSAWADEYKELIVALSPEEYDAAMESTLTAFYTPQTVIAAIYKTLENLGFKQGNILEPSCGIGNFIGMLPDSMKDSKMYGIELDSISAQIAQQLYQKSSVLASPFEEAILPDSFFDAVVGNVPFGDFKVADKRYDKNNFLIHDYFFAKSLDKLRTGGVMLLVTSMGTMDKENSNVRRYIAQRADLLGAIRLPNDTFKGNAGTDVTSDILILQKRDRIVNEEPDWLMLDNTEDGIRMNKYFVDHPEMIMGNMVMKSGRFGPEPTCQPFEDRTLEEQLNVAVRNIKGEITEYEIDEEEIEDDRQYLPADPTVRNFSYTVVDGTIFYRENSMMKEVKVSATAENRIKGLINIRQSVRRLIELQTEDYPEEEIQSEQQNLNELYDGFTAKYGLINSRANKSAFADDGSYYLLTALEVLDDEGNLERKADMFTKRTIKPHIPVTSVDTSIEAVAVSMGEKAELDMEYMMQLTGKTEEEIADDLTGIIFLNPMYSEDRPAEKKYLMADEYLSGDVRAKLRVAENMAKVNPAFEVNAEALRKVQPKDLTASEIDVRLGATWLPTKYIQQFIFELLDPPYYYSYKIKVNYSHYTGEWNITGKSSDKGNVKANSTYGTTRINAYKIIEQTLNLKDVRIFDYEIDDNGKRTPVLNKKETAIAQAKQELIKQAFKDWIWTDPDRRTELTRLYNDKFNSIRPREYDGSHITFSGMNPEISLRPHQKNAVAHILYGGNTLLAHAVGAGKTFEMVAAAQESKRLGLCTKSLFVVPNHLTEQWAAEYLTLYPSANILVATKKDFETKNRKTFCGKIATGDYDAVIIGHSQFEKIPVSVERQIYLIEEQINDIVRGIEEAKRNNAENFTVKQMKKTQKSLEARLKKLNDQTRKDDVVTFEELGVDRLFIDESHYYKNLFLYTKMRNVGGIAQTEAQKSSDLFMKCRYLDELTGGKGTVFATGTPISNSMVELYTIQRYLQYETLRRHDLQHFDAWASTFGETVTAVELTPEGTGYRAKTRFARFYNLPELMSMFKEVADIQTADMLNLPVPKANYHNIAVKPSEIQTKMVESLSERAEKVRSGEVKSWDDNMLVITNDGRKLALDQRMIDPLLPDFDGSKVNACTDNIFQIWQDNADKKSAQLVFCDLSTPKADTFSVYTDIRDKLIAKGIPESEIAFIHNAKTEVQKAEMFKKVRKGEIRVLLGSTQKMGAGTNVQDRLIALHDLDCPWRPSDLEQRSGRIIRQGNSNEEVEIFRYVTEQTFDAYLYQLVEGKQKFASQIMSSKSPVRSAEDIDETALSYAEIKMLATGNPYIKEKMDLDIQVQKLRLLKSNYLSERYSLEDKVLKEFPQKLAEYDERIAGLEKDIVIAKDNPKSVADTFVGMVVNGVPYSEKTDAGQAIIDVCKTLPDTQIYPLGEYRGFKLSVHYEPFSHQHRVTIKGTISHEGVLGTDAIGNITRIDNVIDGLEQMLTTTKALRDTTETQLANAKEQLEKPFAKDEELKQKEARLRELNALLNVDKRENELVDEEPDVSSDDEPKRSEHELNER